MATAAQARQETYGESGDLSQHAHPTRSLAHSPTPRSGRSIRSGLLQPPAATLSPPV